MVKKTAIISFLLIIFHASPGAATVLEINGYDSPVDFTDRKVVLIQKGDDMAYGDPLTDDSSWMVVSLPSSWHSVFPGWEGICWYRIRMKFTGGIPLNALGISLGTISDADEVYFNGHRIGKTGNFSPDRASSYDKKRIYEIPSQHIIPGGMNVLAVRVEGLFPGECGPTKGDFRIGYLRDLQRNFFRAELLEAFFVIIYLVVGIYFGFIFIRGRIDREYLFFSLLTISSALYLFLRTQIKYLLFNDFYLLKKGEYVILLCIPVLLMEYITGFFDNKHTRLHYAYYVITVLLLSIVVFSGSPLAWNRVLLFAAEPSWLIPVSYTAYHTIREYKNERDAKFMLFAIPFMLMIFVNDVMVDRGLYSFIRLSNYGFLALIIGTAAIMRNRHMRIYREIEDFRRKKSGRPSLTGDSRDKLDKIIGYLNENYKSDIAREGLAEYVEMNMDYLGKVFKEYTGKKISDYINDLRIKEAARLLAREDAKVIDIAFSVGFDNLSTFYRVFQGIMGESPTSFRERIVRGKG